MVNPAIGLENTWTLWLALDRNCMLICVNTLEVQMEQTRVFAKLKLLH